MTAELRGIIAPFTTPFHEDGSIDFGAIKPQVDWLLDNGCHGLAAGGSTGEVHVLDRAEYVALMTATRDAIRHFASPSGNRPGAGLTYFWLQIVRHLSGASNFHSALGSNSWSGSVYCVA